MRFGLCLSPEANDRIARDPNIDAQTLPDLVLRAEFGDPEHVDNHLRRQIEVFIQRGLRFPCPCCGYAIHTRPPGSYDLCPICFWEDDGLQLEFASTLAGGANEPTLLQAQLNYTECGSCEAGAAKHVRVPTRADHLDPDWRCIDPDRDAFPDWNEADPRRAPALDLRLYYWRPDYWFRVRDGRLTSG